MAWNDLIQKKVFLIIDTSVGERKYSGIVNEITFLGKNTSGVEVFLILMTDANNGRQVGFASSQIKLIQEEK